MKKILAATLFLSMSAVGYADDDKLIASSDLPAEIQSYLQTHFPRNAIVQASVDKEVFSKTHEVILQDNITVEFNSKNKAEEISSNSQLPNSVIPASVLAYVKKRFPNNYITDWELDDNKQKVELNNDTEIAFDLAGQFLKIDD